MPSLELDTKNYEKPINDVSQQIKSQHIIMIVIALILGIIFVSLILVKYIEQALGPWFWIIYLIELISFIKVNSEINPINSVKVLSFFIWQISQQLNSLNLDNTSSKKEIFSYLQKAQNCITDMLKDLPDEWSEGQSESLKKLEGILKVINDHLCSDNPSQDFASKSPRSLELLSVNLFQNSKNFTQSCDTITFIYNELKKMHSYERDINESFVKKILNFYEKRSAWEKWIILLIITFSTSFLLLGFLKLDDNTKATISAVIAVGFTSYLNKKS